MTRRRLALAAAGIGALFVGAILLVLAMTGEPPLAPAAPAPAAGPGPVAPSREAPRAAPAPPPPSPRAAAPASSGPAAHARPRPPIPRAPAGDPRDAGLHVSFKLDPRLTSGMQMGARWVSPPTYSVSGDPGKVRVAARARPLDAAPAKAPARIAWSASEPDMVEVSPEEGRDILITVWREGESRLVVSAGAASRTLVVTAARRGGAFRVDIAQ